MFLTPRLHVREILQGDYDAMLRIYGDPVEMRWVDDAQPLSPEDCQQWIEVTHRNYRIRGYGMAAVEHREDGVVIGFCGLVHPGGQEVAELKYAMAPEHQGLGYATEAAVGMLRYGLEVHGIREVIATTAPENKASHRVLAKCGMEDSGTTVDGDGDQIQHFRWRAGGPGE